MGTAGAGSPDLTIRLENDVPAMGSLQAHPPNGPAAPDQSQRRLHGFAHFVALVLDLGHATSLPLRAGPMMPALRLDFGG